MVYLLFSKQALSSAFLYLHFVQAVPSVENDFPPLSLILFISFSLFHSSRPNRQTTSSMKLPSISWVQLSLLWTNRRIWYSLENSTLHELLSKLQLCVRHIFLSAGDTQVSNMSSFLIKDLLDLESHQLEVIQVLAESYKYPETQKGPFEGGAIQLSLEGKWGVGSVMKTRVGKSLQMRKKLDQQPEHLKGQLSTA